MTRIAVVSDTTNLEQRVRDAFGGALNGELGTWSNLVQSPDPAAWVAKLVAAMPSVVAIGPDVPIDWALQLTAALDSMRPDTTVMLLATPTTELWERAARAGARDLLAADVEGPALRDAIERGLAATDRRRQAFDSVVPERARGRIIVVISPKGGSGKTTMATNLAIGLAGRAPGQVVVVDLDLQFGDVGNCLHLMPEVSIADLFRSHGPVDATSLKTFLSPHPSGVHTLCAPLDLAEADLVPASELASILQLLSSEFPYVIVDTAAGVDDHSLAAVEQATDLLLLSSTDVPSVRALRRQIDAMERLGVNGATRHFVLNRANAKVGLDVGDIEATVGLPIKVSIPSSKSVPLSTNMGQPLLQDDNRSPTAKAFLELVDVFAAPPDQQSRRGSLLRRGAGE